MPTLWVGNHLALELGNHLTPELGNDLALELGNHLTPKLGNDLAPELANHLTPELGNDLALRPFRLGNIRGPRQLGDNLLVAPVLPNNSFKYLDDVKIPEYSQIPLENGAAISIGINNLKIVARADNPGLSGIKIPFNLKKGQRYIIEFEYSGNTEFIGTRLWSIVNNIQSDVGKFYNDRIQNSTSGRLFREDFVADRGGQYSLYIGKPWGQRHGEVDIELRNIKILRVDEGESASDKNTRMVYLPKGTWYDFWNGDKLEGGQRISKTSCLGHIPVFVKDNSVIPMAKPLQYISRESVFEITPVLFGKNGKSLLLEDDGETELHPLRETMFLSTKVDISSGGDAHVERAAEVFPRLQDQGC